MNLLEVQYNSPLYKKGVEIRKEVFFKVLENADMLIHDELEEASFHYISIVDNRVVATGRLTIQDKEAIISQMAVIPAMQSKGIGFQLLNLFINTCKNNQIQKITLKARLEALKFYERQGFCLVGEVFASKKTGVAHQEMYLNL